MSAPQKLTSGTVGVEEKIAPRRGRPPKVVEKPIEGNPFEGFETKDIVLLVPIEGGHKDRTLELLQELSNTNEFEVPYIAHQIRLDRIGSKVIFPVVAIAGSTTAKPESKRTDWRLHIGAPIECAKALPALSFDSEEDSKPNYGAVARAVQKSLKRKTKDSGPSYQVRLGEDTIITLQSA